MTASSATSNDRPEEKNDTVPMMDAEKHPVKDDLPSDSPDAQPPRTHQAAEWNSPEDAGSPLNWSMAKKAYHAAIPSVHCFTVTFASSVYTPGVPKVQEQFHVSTTVALLPLSLYILGTAFGPMIAAPLSETLGRRAVYFSCLPLSGLLTIGAGFSKSMAGLIVCRFLAGVFGSPPLSVGAGTIADMYPPAQRSWAVSFFILAPFLGPVLGPTIGGFVVEKKDWPWTLWTLLFFVAATMLLSVGIQETYKKTLLERRAKRQGVMIQKTGPQGLEAIKFLMTVTLLRPLRMLVVEPIVASLSLYVAFNFAVVFGFFEAFPIVFVGFYHFDSGQAGLPFLGLGLGACLGVITFVLVDRLTYQKQYHALIREGREGKVVPEHRLYPAMMGSFALPISLFWFAWTAKIHWASPTCAAIPFGWGNFLVFCSAALYLIDTYGALYGASALAANGLLRYVLSSAFPLFTVQMYDNLGIHWATSLFGFIALALMPVPWILFKWGPQIRAKSHYETMVFDKLDSELQVEDVSADGAGKE